ncbi:hypothetical protein [Crinalium epipsammum]|uniref:hypothetical protein n=1 Tax=Crinalium epipsammum TaxID=241425 RepID=UPI0012F9B5AD|nr:hypothetical protein [Crinalium epipsammum]
MRYPFLKPLPCKLFSRRSFRQNRTFLIFYPILTEDFCRDRHSTKSSNKLASSKISPVAYSLKFSMYTYPDSSESIGLVSSKKSLNSLVVSGFSSNSVTLSRIAFSGCMV